MNIIEAFDQLKFGKYMTPNNELDKIYYMGLSNLDFEKKKCRLRMVLITSNCSLNSNASFDYESLMSTDWQECTWNIDWGPEPEDKAKNGDC